MSALEREARDLVAAYPDDHRLDGLRKALQEQARVAPMWTPVAAPKWRDR